MVINDLFADELITSSTGLLDSGASYSAKLLYWNYYTVAYFIVLRYTFRILAGSINGSIVNILRAKFTTLKRAIYMYVYLQRRE